MTRIGNVTLSTSNASLSYRLFGPMALRGGEPLWNVIDRAKRPPLSTWNGRALYVVELPLILDGWAARESVEKELLWLRALMSAGRDDGTAAARRVSIGGVGLVRIPRVDITDMEFVAINLEVDPGSIIRSDRGLLLRCTATLTLQEFLAPPSVDVKLSITKAAKQHRILRVRVLPGDSYIKIGARRSIPKRYRKKVVSYFRKNPRTNSVKKLRDHAGEVFFIPV